MQQMIRIKVAAAAGTDVDDGQTVPGGSGQKWRVVQAEYSDYGGIADDATDYVTFVSKLDATTIDTRATSSTGFTARTEESVAEWVGKILTGGSNVGLEATSAGAGKAYNMALSLVVEPFNGV